MFLSVIVCWYLLVSVDVCFCLLLTVAIFCWLLLSSLGNRSTKKITDIVFYCPLLSVAIPYQLLLTIVPTSPPKTKICVPLCRGGHHSLLVVDNTKKEYAILSSTYAKPNPVDWPQWIYLYNDATPRNVPKTEEW